MLGFRMKIVRPKYNFFHSMVPTKSEKNWLREWFEIHMLNRAVSSRTEGFAALLVEQIRRCMSC